MIRRSRDGSRRASRVFVFISFALRTLFNMANIPSQKKDNNSSGWAFNLRTRQLHDSDDSDDCDEPDEQSNCVSDDTRLMNDFDLSTRIETVNYKPNPWTIAKVNAASRPSEQEKPIPSFSSKSVSSKQQPTGSIVDCFKKQANRFKAASGGVALKPGKATQKNVEAPIKTHSDTRGSSKSKPGPVTLNFPVIVPSRTRNPKISSAHNSSTISIPTKVNNPHTPTSEPFQHHPIADTLTPHAKEPFKSKVFPQSFSSPIQIQGRLSNRVNATSYSSPAVPVNKLPHVPGHAFPGGSLHRQYPLRKPRNFVSDNHTSTLRNSEHRPSPDTLVFDDETVDDLTGHSVPYLDGETQSYVDTQGE